MTLKELIEKARASLDETLTERKTKQDALVAMRAAVEEGDTTVTVEQVDAAIAERDSLDGTLKERKAKLDALLIEQERDDEADKLQADIKPAENVRKPAYDQIARVGSEERTYAPHKEPGFDQKREAFRPGVKAGGDFTRDVATAFFGDYEAQSRLARHQSEERVERPQYFERAAGTGAFAGLTVPQYLTDLYAPAAQALRPFADACNHHELPSQGMTVNLSRITTGTGAAIQASENSAVQETNIDDTLLTINVQTNAGQQTLSRQAIERGANTEAVMLEDLYGRYSTSLDSQLLNQAAVGVAASSTVIAYTSAAPKVVELYPIIVQAQSAVEAALLNQMTGDTITVMHSRRWYWLQNGLSATWPLVSQPGIVPQMLGANFAETYGSGVRGVLPNGSPVIVDNNVTVLGLAGATSGGTQDHVYVLSRKEAHLWEDPSAPVFIRAEQPAAASLGVLFVLYGYFAATFSRYTQSQLISGTGTVPPVFSGV